MKEIKEKSFYHLKNIEKTLDKLNDQEKEHLTFLHDNNDINFKERWGNLLLKN